MSTHSLRRAAAAVLAGVLCAGCASTAEPEAPTSAPAAAAAAPVDAGAPKTLARDARDQDGNFLELLEQEMKATQEAATRAREQETLARTEADRIQGMLQDALVRERRLEEQVLHARLDNVRLEKELVRARIAALSGSDAK